MTGIADTAVLFPFLLVDLVLLPTCVITSSGRFSPGCQYLNLLLKQYTRFPIFPILSVFPHCPSFRHQHSSYTGLSSFRTCTDSLDRCPRASPTVQGPFDPDVGHDHWLSRSGPDHLCTEAWSPTLQRINARTLELRWRPFHEKQVTKSQRQLTTLSRIGGPHRAFPPTTVHTAGF